MKILFFIHDLGRGGAEKVLVNLVNNMDRKKFDITVMALFGGGVNEQFLSKHVKYRAVFPKNIPGNSHIMKLLRPSVLHKLFIKEHYDVEISYLEGPSARIISGCLDPDTKKVCWIHSTFHSKESASRSFRSYEEALMCYGSFDRIVNVSLEVKNAFQKIFPVEIPLDVRYNTNETSLIEKLACQPLNDSLREKFQEGQIRLIQVGKLERVKAVDRVLRIVRKLIDDGYPVHLYLLGCGSEEPALKEYVTQNHLEDVVSFLGYQENPYQFLRNCHLFICSSLSEGFSTAATEALIVGTAVCTTDVSGMRELLGENHEYGLITDNNEESLYTGIKSLLDNRDKLLHYRKMATERGKCFSTARTVRAVEDMINNL